MAACRIPANETRANWGKLTKMPRRSMPQDKRSAAKLLERVFSDLVGPMKHRFIDKSCYFVTLLDSYRGYSLVRFMR